MPLAISNIDAIARREKRGVLYLTFHPSEESPDFEDFEWHHDSRRCEIIKWLDANGIGWSPCGEPVQGRCFVRYRGQIYIDLELNEADPRYRRLCEHLEHPDGSMRDPSIGFIFLRLELTMVNAYQDEPGFWDDL